METLDIILAIESGGALAIASVALLIVFRTFREVEDPAVKEFSKRFMFMVSLMVLLTAYTMFYNTHLYNIPAFSYTLFVLIALVFIGIIYSTLAFERMASTHGLKNESKVRKMEREEGL